MPTQILMPALSPTMEQGKLSKWLKKEGDKVASGNPIAEIETDKATMEVEAVDEGTIGKIMIPEGTEGVAVNTPIAVLLSEGEDAAALKGYGAGPAQPAPKQAPQPQAETPRTAPPKAGRPAPVPEPRPSNPRRLKRRPRPRRQTARAAFSRRRSPGGSRRSRASTCPGFGDLGRMGAS